MKNRVRQQFGSIVFDKRIKTWNFLWWENGKRRSKAIGTVHQFPTKTSAWRAAKALRQMLESTTGTISSNTPSVRALVEKYRAEKMPSRSDTRRTYEVWLRNHIIPKWGNSALSDVQARPVELWLESLPLAPKSKAHIRGLLSILWDFAMWSGDLPMQRNPMEIVKVKGATRRMRQPRSLTVDEFQRFCSCLLEPFETVALLCCCLGLRISECLGLKWCDVDWLNSTLRVERGIVSQRVDEVKTTESVLRATHDLSPFASDVCLTDTGWQAALVISSGLAHVSKGSKQGGYRQAGYAQSAVHPQNMAGRRWHSDWCAAEAHASRRYSHHDEYLWRRSDRRHASSTQQDRPLGAANFPNGLWNGLWVSVSI